MQISCVCSGRLDRLRVQGWGLTRFVEGYDMNYFELINKCLVELNYKQVFTFSELTKNEHLKLKNIINMLNTEICNSEKWNFLLRKTEFKIKKNASEIQNPIKGKIALFRIDGKKYEYFDDFEKFFINAQPPYTYTTFNDKLLLPAFEEEKAAEIVYYTSNYAVSSDGVEKTLLEAETDSSVIPEIFAEPVLVYGACMRLKGNPQHIRFSYWLSMYKDALANLRSKYGVDANASPDIVLHRK